MRTILSLCLALALASPTFAQKEKPKAVTPVREWVEVITDNKKADDAPGDGYLSDAKEFEKLWKSWRKDEKVPEVDFRKQIVVITLSKGGPNKPKCRATLGDDGDLKILAFSTRIGGDGFGYSIGVYPKAGVKKVNGKAVK